MRKLSVFFVLAASAGAMLLPQIVAAQEQPKGAMPPPPVLVMLREEVKHGKQTAHDKNETAWTQALVRAKYPTSMYGLDSVTGPSEAIWLIGFPTFAAVEADFKLQNSGVIEAINAQYGAQEADDVSGDSELIARHREDLSYGSPINIGEYRYMQIAVTRVRPGHNADYEEYLKTVNEARKATNSTANIAVYQVTSGGFTGTFISFTPRKSLAEFDAPPNQAMTDAMKPNQEKVGQLIDKSVTSTNTAIYAFNPRMSNPSEAVAATDPSFWKPKAVMAAKSPASSSDDAAKKPASKKTNK